jgi:hypothetical protein
VRQVGQKVGADIAMACHGTSRALILGALGIRQQASSRPCSLAGKYSAFYCQAVIGSGFVWGSLGGKSPLSG